MFIEEKAPGEVKEMDEAAKLLLKAAAVIEENGHAQNDYEVHGRFCAVGAICKAAGSVYEGRRTPEATAGIQRLREAVERAGLAGILDWNDYPGRTKDEVVAKLRAVALGG